MKRVLPIMLAIVICLLSTPLDGAEMNSWFVVKTIEKGNYAIPLLVSERHPVIANRINQTIQMYTVKCLYEVVGEEKLFAHMLDEHLHGITSMKYEVLTNNASILSISIGREAVGAYSSSFTSFLNFNAATGKLIDPYELFTEKGWNHLNNMVSKHINETIRSEFKYLPAKTQDNEDRDILFQLTECNATQDIYLWGIKGDRIIAHKGSCLPHRIQCYDINWSCEIEIDKLFHSDFTSAGTKMLEDQLPVPSIKYLLYPKQKMSIHGEIDHKYAFTMILHNHSDYISGQYWYNKNGGIIPIKVNRVGPNTLEVTEEDGKFIIVINLDGTLTGHWTNSKGKQFPIEFDGSL
ncbi:hypothetical protein OAT16_09890 [Prolixibacteraceae bacterium]|nr:hypothetical protein [Prolixibacteraceae bacterium]